MTQTTLDLDTDRLRLEVDDDGIATVWIDDPTDRVNKISEPTLDAFNEVLERLETDGAIRGAVFISGKEDSFIVGADIEMLQGFASPADAREASRLGHRMVARVQNLSIPTVTAIHGPCMGGGTEFALGCTYRIASTGDATKIALPEVKLGLLPGSGGTQHLPRLVGVQQALTMMLTGKNMYPKKAKRMGLVDALIHPPGLHQAAKRAALGLARGEISPDRNDQGFATRILESNTVSRRIIYQQAAKRTRQRTHGNYPAPPKIIECVKVGMEQGLEAGLDAETRHFADLIFTPESRALVSLFFAKRKGDTNPYKEQAHALDTIGVLGAGLMGGGIAQVSASNDLDVVLKDQNLELAAGGKKHAWKALHKKASKGILSEFERDKIVERIVPTDDYAPLRNCDVVIEAVPENLELKQSVLAETEAVIRDDAVFASNTSSIPIADIAAEAEHPERVLGMHYFSPVPQMPLLEIIVTEATSDATLATAYEAGVRQGKTVIVVNDGPGFYTTRILAIYMNEALLLLEEGADAEAVDAAMQDWGFPMGPFELFDLVGIDVAAKITDVMREHLDMDRLTISNAASTLVDADLLGQKTNRGFYVYDEDDTSDDKDPEEFNTEVYHYFGGTERTSVPDYEVKERMGMMMVNESIRCLEEGILNDPVDGDLGAVFGLGFPPFRGGPFRYVDQEGAAATHTRLERLTRQHGDRFTPATLLAKHAESEQSFYEE
jgi:3-hydroxyacyl-CoA dehydrogenase/enoyl-CoA hydratase/3-hydroxybutyryl-CoA epimerase